MYAYGSSFSWAWCAPLVLMVGYTVASVWIIAPDIEALLEQ
jgi:hypothetical protein